MSIFQTYFQCLMILSDLPIQLINYFPWPHQNLAAMLKVVKSVVHFHRPQMMFNLHGTWHIWSSDQAEQMCQLSEIQNRLAVTANQTWWQSSPTGTRPVLSTSLTYHSQTWYIDNSWHHSGDIQTIWWPLTGGARQTGSDFISLQGLHASKTNLAHSLMTLSWWCPNNLVWFDF
jgi:hypothetical protein